MQTKKPSIAWTPAIFIVITHFLALLGIFTFSINALILCIALYLITGGLGITLCFHRLLTHRSFQVPKWFEYFLAVLGTLALQGGPITWVGIHRFHHLYSDTNEDPHSPKRGFWWSHMEWTLRKVGCTYSEQYKKLISDLTKDKVFIFLDDYPILWTILLGLFLYFWGGWAFVIWGIFVRLVLTWHCTWLVNSACHIWGYQTYITKDNSKNNWWVALLSFGEGWHHNHHKYPNSARHGLQWWELDMTYLTIKILKFLGIAKNLRSVKASTQQ